MDQLKESLPFLSIGLGGMLVSKSDLYIIGMIGSEDDLGKYQVLITLIVYFQAIAGFIATPYIKNMYRIDLKAFKEISRKYYMMGLLVSIVSIPIIHIILLYFYSLDFNHLVYIPAFVAILSIYLYSPKVTLLYREQKESLVMKVNFIAAGLSALLTFVLFRFIGIEGALVAVAIVQLILLIYYRKTTMNQLKMNA